MHDREVAIVYVVFAFAQMGDKIYLTNVAITSQLNIFYPRSLLHAPLS